MALRLYNTLTHRVEELAPLRPGEVRMYTCGPTVYHYAHIGNLRTFVFQDLLRRTLLYKGLRLTHVMNITDVEDKIIARAREEGVSIGEYTERFTRAFLEDLEALRIQRPEIMPRATEHIEEMLELIGRLKEQGHTYQQDGSTYFRIASFEDYGKLSRVDLSQADPHTAGEEDEYGKENPRDFALWKSRRPEEAYWESDFGEGRPGWHIECSAMSMKYLGESFDIHCGGVDLIFPHHENEIAQSEAATGKPFVKHWVHAAHLIVEGEKMSKSAGNFYTLRDLLDQGHSPVAVRYLLASVHYRRQLNFTMAGLEQAQAALQRVDDFLLRVREVPDGADDEQPLEDLVARARAGFEAGLEDDLNTSEALAALFTLIKEVYPDLEAGRVGSGGRDEVLRLFEDANRVFDTFRVEEQTLDDARIEVLIEEREEARRRRDFGRADGIRDELTARGILLEDTKEGTRWKKVN